MCDDNNMIPANTCACHEIRRHLFEGLMELSIYSNVYIHTERQAASYTYNVYVCIICVCTGLLISSFHYIQSEY